MVAELFNSSLEFGSLFNQATLYFTGDIFITLLIVLAFLFLVGIMFRTPALLVIILLLPLIIVFSEFDYSGGFGTVLLVLVIVLGFVVARSFFAYR